MLQLMGKKIFTILAQMFCLSKPVLLSSFHYKQSLVLHVNQMLSPSLYSKDQKLHAGYFLMILFSAADIFLSGTLEKKESW